MIILKWIGIGLLILVVVVLVFGIYQMFSQASLSQKNAPQLGVQNEALIACPDSPNCVNSFARDVQHGIPPISGDEEALAALAAHIAETSGAEIREMTPNYLRAEYKSGFFGFVDDLELYFDGDRIQVRSSSRVGYSDMSANRTRVESLRSYLEER